MMGWRKSNFFSDCINYSDDNDNTPNIVFYDPKNKKWEQAFYPANEICGQLNGILKSTRTR